MSTAVIGLVRETEPDTATVLRMSTAVIGLVRETEPDTATVLRMSTAVIGATSVILNALKVPLTAAKFPLLSPIVTSSTVDSKSGTRTFKAFPSLPPKETTVALMLWFVPSVSSTPPMVTSAALRTIAMSFRFVMYPARAYKGLFASFSIGIHEKVSAIPILYEGGCPGVPVIIGVRVATILIIQIFYEVPENL